MSLFQVNESTFLEVKELLRDRVPDSKIIYDLGLRKPTLNIIKKYDDFTEYEEHFSGHDETPDKEEEQVATELDSVPPSPVSAIVAPYQRGYFRGTITKEKDPYTDMREGLGVSIKGLWKIIGLLEQRKLELERQIRHMEGYIAKGAAIIENEIEA